MTLSRHLCEKPIYWQDYIICLVWKYFISSEISFSKVIEKIPRRRFILFQLVLQMASSINFDHGDIWLGYQKLI